MSRCSLAAILLLLAVLSGCSTPALPTLWSACPTAMLESPMWSPNGREITFSANGDLYRVNITTAENSRLTSIPGDETNPVWSPDGRRIAFTYRDLAPQVAIMDVESGQFEYLSEPFTDIGGYAWSPSSDQIVWQVQHTTDLRTEIAILDLTTGNTQVVLSDIRRMQAPALSPDGQQIVVITTDGLNLINVEGKYLRTLLPTSTISLPILWSPNAAYIAFATSNPVDPEDSYLNILPPDEASLTKLMPERPQSFTWLPDSSGLVALRADGSIVKISVEDRLLIQLSTLSPNITFSSFSPDATQIAYIDAASGFEELYVMNINGTDVRQLTSNPGRRKCFNGIT